MTIKVKFNRLCNNWVEKSEKRVSQRVKTANINILNCVGNSIDGAANIGGFRQNSVKRELPNYIFGAIHTS